MDEFKNWVERRFVIEALQAKRAPELWQEVRSALQDACDSFNEHYGSATDQVECALAGVSHDNESKGGVSFAG